VRFALASTLALAQQNVALAAARVVAQEAELAALEMPHLPEDRQRRCRLELYAFSRCSFVIPGRPKPKPARCGPATLAAIATSDGTPDPFAMASWQRLFEQVQVEPELTRRCYQDF